MSENKLEKYYKLKQDIEKVDKFISEYFISQERKDKKVNSSFQFRFQSLNGSDGHVILDDITTFCKILSETFNEMRPELISRTLEKMKKNLAELREEIKTECNEFLTNECGPN